MNYGLLISNDEAKVSFNIYKRTLQSRACQSFMSLQSVIFTNLFLSKGIVWWFRCYVRLCLPQISKLKLWAFRS